MTSNSALNRRSFLARSAAVAAVPAVAPWPGAPSPNRRPPMRCPTTRPYRRPRWAPPSTRRAITSLG